MKLTVKNVILIGYFVQFRIQVKINNDLYIDCNVHELKIFQKFILHFRIITFGNHLWTFLLLHQIQWGLNVIVCHRSVDKIIVRVKEGNCPPPPIRYAYAVYFTACNDYSRHGITAQDHVTWAFVETHPLIYEMLGYVEIPQANHE